MICGFTLHRVLGARALTQDGPIFDNDRPQKHTNSNAGGKHKLWVVDRFNTHANCRKSGHNDNSLPRTLYRFYVVRV